MWQVGWSKAAAFIATGGLLVAGAGLAGGRADLPADTKVPVAADPSKPGVAAMECRMQFVDSVRFVRVTVRDRGRERVEMREVLSHRDSVHLRDCEDRYRALSALQGEAVRLGLLRMGIPEYNDEQRFLAAPGIFGPKVTIIASANLDGFRFDEQYTSHDTRGVLSALIFVDTVPSADLSTYAQYRALGLAAGVNCLWVSYRSSGTPGWRARVTRSGAVWSCADDGPGTDLGVRRQSFGPAVGFLDVPAVARFEWDVAERPLLGVKCLTGWCTIGPSSPSGGPAFTVQRLAEGVPELVALGNSVGIAGWHDEQRLANYVAGVAVPGTVRATLIPATTTILPDLGVGQRRLVGYVFLHDPPGTTRYAAWGLRQGLNEIYLALESPDLHRIFVRSIDPSGAGSPAVRWTNVVRHEHFDAALVSTARFRWIATDDGIWVACGQGCCRMDGEY